MKLVKISSAKPAEDYLAERIGIQLARGQRVFWLVPGGSAMQVAIGAGKKIKPLPAKLSICLTDERFGPPGHPDSNWQQLTKAGFKIPGAEFLPVLNGSSLPKTALAYQSLLLHEAQKAGYFVALAGMGPDGHIFGIKPGSPAVAGQKYVAGYRWDDYDRLTPTIKLLKLANEVVIYAMGKEKWPQLDRLYEDINPADQPAQLLKQFKKVIIFNDYKEGSL